MFVLRIVRGLDFAAGAPTHFTLPNAPARVVIGRDPRAEWPLPDETLALSARHCEIVVAPPAVLLRDLSTNGTFVNGASSRMAQEHALAAGDAFDLGPYRVAVEGVQPVAVARHTRLDVVVDEPAPPVSASPPVLTQAIATPRPPATLQALADGLGLDAAALAGHDTDALVRRTALVARLAVAGLRRLLEEEARAKRRLGSRQTMPVPLRDTNPLRLARSPDEALLRLLATDHGAVDATREACSALLSHDEQLQAAFAGAVRRLATDLEPASLDAALGPLAGPAGSAQRKAALWDLYGGLWQRLGLGSAGSADGEGAAWAAGFIDAAMVHLAAAYDDTRDDGREPPLY